MSSLSRNRSPARWPFWLLIVAWVCANSPQAATYAVLTWMSEARNFSHQHRLTSQVVHVLTGQSESTQLAALPATGGKPALPSVPADAILKKLDLAFEGTREVLPIALRERHRMVRVLPPHERMGVAPPHEPPRGGLKS